MTIAVADRYEITQNIANTALGDFFIAHDWLADLPANGNHNPLILMSVAENLNTLPEFDTALSKVLGAFRHHQPFPTINDWRFDRNTFWIAFIVPHADLSSAGKIPDTGLDGSPTFSLAKLLKSTKSILPNGGFGFLEPGAIWHDDAGQAYPLNAPVAITTRLLLEALQKQGVNPTIQFHSPYISPQVAQGLPATPQDDTFSIAVMAYEAFTKTLPFGPLSSLDAMGRNLQPVKASNIPPEAWLALQRGLSFQRHQRQASPYELLHALVSIPKELPAKHDTKPFPYRTTGLGAATLVSAVGLAYLVLQEGTPPQPAQPIAHAPSPNIIETVQPARVLPTRAEPITNIQPKPVEEQQRNAAANQRVATTQRQPVPVKPAPAKAEPITKRDSATAAPVQASPVPKTPPAAPPQANVNNTPAPHATLQAARQTAPHQHTPPKQAPQPVPTAATPPRQIILHQQDTNTFIVVQPNAPAPPPLRQAVQVDQNTFVVQ